MRHVLADGVPPGPGSVAIRPWEVVVAATPSAGSARNVVAAQVCEVLPLGGRVRLVLAVGSAGVLPRVVEITLEAQSDRDGWNSQTLSASFKAMAVTVHPR